MKKTFKKLMAFAMVAVMMANPMSALAAQTTTEETTTPAKGSADASGNVEDFVDTTIFKVVLPTSADGVFNFKMDPQGLIAKTSGEALEGATYEDDATVLFNTASADAASGDWKSKSKYIEVLNRGTVAVNVSVEATVTGLSTIKMASSDSFTSGDAAVPELYLAFTASGDASGDAMENKGKSPVAILTTNEKTSATINAVLPAADASLYEFTWASGDGYSYDLTSGNASGDASTFPDYSFALTGACNPYADWTDVKDVAPAVKVVWTLEDASEKQLEPTMDVTAAGVVTLKNLSATANYVAAKATITGADNKTYQLEQYATADKSKWSEAEGGDLTITLTDAARNYYNTYNVRFDIELSNGTKFSKTVTIAK